MSRSGKSNKACTVTLGSEQEPGGHESDEECLSEGGEYNEEIIVSIKKSLI